MNKKIKVMFASLLSISCLSMFSPVNLSFITTKAYAEVSTYSLADKGELKSLDVQSTDGESLELCDDYSGYKKYLTDDKDYYVTLDKNSDGVKIFGEVEGEGYIAKVFESDRNYATPHDMEEDISIKEGKTTLYVRTYTSEAALERAVDDENISNCAKTYKINIIKSESNDIYLNNLTLDSGKIPINFDEENFIYNVTINGNQDDIEIKAEPKDDDCTVKIGGFTVDEDDGYKKDLHFKMGLNVVKINLTDLDDNITTYTINVIRGEKSNTNTSNGPNAAQVDKNIKANQWVLINGVWEYNDSTGAPVRNSWYYDKNYGKTYYLKEDGTMAVNWLSLGGNWYYLGADGARKTDWQNVNGEWYFLDSNGVMMTGWIKDTNGKYYYMQSNGAMAKNTKIDGYRLGSDGAWIK
ncbi:cell wall binding repeat-containing protein [Clostridium sp. DL-VIII]|uniref:N-acetylmuramoyl-L-alanine amidase family protein n=1 Tax=Clostridium sp. DL-VIII TaxID=641107 RepID=UPI00023B0790|nr:cadherin-like beta sandwich domain-containing protein [Clostridium sp. DL-VIII]EHJ02148.1 cell wall binding repeat-containing protein [Clostridium sp. DL-VIII]